MLIALILMGAGLAVCLISFWWERSFLKRVIQERVDAAFANPNENAEDLLQRCEIEKTVIEWMRVARAGLLLAAVLIALFFNLKQDAQSPPIHIES